MKHLSLKSYAKINLSLDIVNKRDDGYHDIDSVFVPIELHDSLLFSFKPNSQSHTVTVDDYSILNSEYNLATKAIKALEETHNFNQKFKIFIHKNIPMQAGLGGGSSNAAFALRGVNKMLKLNINNDDLKNTAKRLGADVPFFIDCTPSRVTGIGEIVEPITIKNDYYVLLVKPIDKGCATKDIFTDYDSHPQVRVDINQVVKALEEGDDELFAKVAGNALEESASRFVPEIREIKEKLLQEGLKIVLMSGSGSTVFALSQDKKLLKKVARSFEDDYFVALTKIIK